MDVDTVGNCSFTEALCAEVYEELSKPSLSSGVPYLSALEPLVDESGPIITFGPQLLADSRGARSCSLLGQMSGWNIPLRTLLQRIPWIWCVKGSVEILELANQLYLGVYKNSIRTKKSI